MFCPLYRGLYHTKLPRFVGAAHDEDENTFKLTAVLEADDDNIPDHPTDPDDVDWSKWHGLIHADNLADLEFIANAKADVAALIREVERLQALVAS